MGNKPSYGELEQRIRELEDSSALGKMAESKQAQAALEASEARFRTIFESAQDGIFMIDFDTGKRRYANQAMADMLGYAKEELLAERFQDNVDPETLQTGRTVSGDPADFGKPIRTDKPAP